MVSEELRDKYWNILNGTRQSGRISPSVIRRVEESWSKFDDDVVEEALAYIFPTTKHTKKITLSVLCVISRRKKQRVYR